MAQVKTTAQGQQRHAQRGMIGFRALVRRRPGIQRQEAILVGASNPLFKGVQVPTVAYLSEHRQSDSNGHHQDDRQWQPVAEEGTYTHQMI